MAGLSLLRIGNARWQDAVTVRVGTISASWQVSGAGRLSAVLPSRDLQQLGARTLKGRWVLWDHHTLGLWGGIVQDEAVDLFTGMVELGCSSLVELLRKRRVARTYRVQAAPAGALALRAITDANNDRDLLLDDYQADEDGDLLAVEWRGDDLFGVIDSLATASDHEYDVRLEADMTILFEFRKRVGTDRTGSVLLIEGRDVLDGSVQGSIYDLTNDILAVSADEDWARRDHAVAVHADSIETYGRAQTTLAYDYATRRSSLVTRAVDDLRTMALPAITATLRVAGDNPVLAQFTHGDTVRFWSASANAMYRFRVVSRAIDDGNVVTLAGDLTEIA